jgi:uncharacterized protein YndB with AHSA1/START domain
MEEADHVARASVTIKAPRNKVWDALVDPDAIKEYMFGAEVISDWVEGSSIVWKGEWEGKPYEDRGIIQQLLPGTRLHYSHYSPLSGQPDVPENYHHVTIDLSDLGEEGTRVYLSQDGNATEEARLHSERNWEAMLKGLKSFVEGRTMREDRDKHADGSDAGSVAQAPR